MLALPHPLCDGLSRLCFPPSPSFPGSVWSKSKLRNGGLHGLGAMTTTPGPFKCKESLQMATLPGTGRPWKIYGLISWRQRFFWMLSWSSLFPNCKNDFCGIFLTSSERTLFCRHILRDPWTVSLLGPAA